MKLLLTLFLFLASNAGAFDVLGSLPQGLGDGRYVQKAGDTMTGPLTLSGSSLTVTGNAFSVGGSTFVIVASSVGVGMTDPAAKLEVSGGTNRTGIFRVTQRVSGAVSYGLDIGMDPPTGDPVFGRIVANVVTEALRIQRATGNVGIATTNPNTKLHISSSTITMDGTGAPTVGGALCLNTAGQMAKCTSAIDASGNCTCP